jgi:hypothetical protein
LAKPFEIDELGMMVARYLLDFPEQKLPSTLIPCPHKAIGEVFLAPVWYTPSDDDNPVSLLGE